VEITWQVLPPQSGLRQWVLTFPFSWRRRLAQDAALLGRLTRNRRGDGAGLLRRAGGRVGAGPRAASSPWCYYYYGREATSNGPGGRNLEVTVTWQGDPIVTEEKQAKGKGRVRAVYTLLPGGQSLQVDWHLEHDSMKQPLDLRPFGGPDPLRIRPASRAARRLTGSSR